TVLVERHGPVVLGLCRRVLRHAQDADDACQATFLVLARKAATLRKRISLASWLHGVAYRTSVNLKRPGAAAAARTTRRDTPQSPRRRRRVLARAARHPRRRARARAGALSGAVDSVLLGRQDAR